MSKKILTLNDVDQIRKIADDLIRDKYTSLKDYSIYEYHSDQSELKAEYRLKGCTSQVDEVAHAWANAVVLYLKVKGYKIEKDEKL